MNYVWVDTIFTEDGHERFFLEDPPAFKEKNKVLKKLAVFAVGLFAIPEIIAGLRNKALTDYTFGHTTGQTNKNVHKICTGETAMHRVYT